MIRHPLAALSYLAYIVAAIGSGTWQICRAAVSRRRLIRPGIVELPLRCRTDGEIVAMSSSITITPGTLVVGTAAATRTAPPTLFVHAMFCSDREAVLADLRDMETRLLRVTRGRESRLEPDPSSNGGT
ncbi:Na+/H+ antiporter subunit E [Mobilicoccus massiliensis]|uniref:Na+/H+ antiporter subunit E n=1 Tax=Mobilicoccus massiliensis TaxID=1522310 RepID=UPI0006931FD7|nr:Na+/H+ antiporter subunit E [Mobilicoccus massiliensis]